MLVWGSPIMHTTVPATMLLMMTTTISVPTEKRDPRNCALSGECELRERHACATDSAGAFREIMMEYLIFSKHMAGKRLVAAVAVTSQWGIGLGGQLPWSVRLK